MRRLKILTGVGGHFPFLHHFYPTRALRELGHLVIEYDDVPDHPIKWDRNKTGWWDLIFHQESQYFREMKKGVFKCPTAYWSVDSYRTSFRDKLIYPEYDYFFFACAEYVKKYRGNNLQNVYYLPFACDPGLHKPIFNFIDGKWSKVPEVHDVGFVGNPNPDERQLVLKKAKDAGLDVKVHWCGQRADAMLTPLQISHFMSDCKIGFNFSGIAGANMRIYELMAMGKCVVTNRKVDGEPLNIFKNDEHLLIYGTEDDAVNKMKQLLDNDKRRNRIAMAGMKEVLEKHTYVKRMEYLLDTVGIKWK